MLREIVQAKQVSYMFEVHARGEWCGNGQRFATKEEAEQAGRDLLSRWYVPDSYRVVETSGPVNYAIVDNELHSVTA